MAANTYFGTGKMTKIYLGTINILKVYLGINLVFGGVVPPAPPLVQQIYTDFDLDLQAFKPATNNVYTDFDLDLQTIKGL
jgi:hypothetical protein